MNINLSILTTREVIQNKFANDKLITSLYIIATWGIHYLARYSILGPGKSHNTVNYNLDINL